MDLDAFYPVPRNPALCDRDWDRWTHADLSSMTHEEILLERERLKFRLTLDKKPHPWLFERLAALEERLK
jgi:hypothetical protein